MHGSTFPRNVSPYEYHPTKIQSISVPRRPLSPAVPRWYVVCHHIIVGKHEHWADGSARCLNRVWILWNTFVKIHATEHFKCV